MVGKNHCWFESARLSHVDDLIACTLSGTVLFSFGTNGVYSVFCREKSNALEMRAPVSLRNKTLKEILAEVKSATGVGFTVPKASYTTRPIAYCF